MNNNLQPVDSHQCRELERLAAAAASLDYNETSIQPPKIYENGGAQSSTITVTNSAPAAGDSIAIPHVVSYIDAYQLPRSNHFVSLRPSGSQELPLNQIQPSVQPISCSRIVMVPVVNNSHRPNDVQYVRSVSCLNVAETPYQNESVTVLADASYTSRNKESNDGITSYANISKVGEECQSEKHILKQSTSTLSSSDTNSASTSISVIGKRKIKKPISLRETDADDRIELQAHTSNLPVEGTSNTDSDWKKQHTKRNGLPLEVKIEIIKRVLAGEKKADMSDEYGVNQSTIKSVMKKADLYMACWKKGLFNPDSKRLKKPKREDVEQALYSWYKQSLENGNPVSGSILCSKAIDFAHKLGHYDFKATHGWLDRFKKRKKITFGRGSNKKKESKVSNDPNDLQETGVQQVVADYDANDILAVQHLGLFYNALPTNVDSLRGQKCAGGIKAKERLSILLCMNMTGIEKYPPLLIGKCKKSVVIRSVKTLLAHYIFNENSWLTTEIISSWLLDMDSWFSQQNRKVVLLVPAIPIYSRIPDLRAVKVIIIPSLSFVPFQQAIVPHFKKLYRKKYLQEIVVDPIEEISRKEIAQGLSLVTCMKLLSISWQSFPNNLIMNGFQTIGISKYDMWNIIAPQEDSAFVCAQELTTNILQALDHTDNVSFNDFVYCDDQLQVCNMMGDDDILAKITANLQDIDESSDSDEEVNNKENGETPIRMAPFTQVESAFAVLRKYIQYQEGAQEMFRELAHLEHIIYKSLPE